MRRRADFECGRYAPAWFYDPKMRRPPFFFAGKQEIREFNRKGIGNNPNTDSTIGEESR
jgi:hypothetical protein